MDRQRRRALGYLGLVAAAVLAYTLAYWWGMAAVEGRPRSLLRSLTVVVETFTTVGYGEDAPWTTPGMNALMVLMQLSGVSLVFLALPLFVAPWLESRLELRLPATYEGTGHVVVCGVTPRTRTLGEELENRGVAYTYVTADRETAQAVHEDDDAVVHGDPESVSTLEDAGADAARAVVCDAGDEANATIALSMRELAPEVRVVALLDEPERRAYLEYAGADSVHSPRELLGRTLADKVTSSVTTKLGDTVSIGQDFELAELPVQAGSPVDGVSLAESGVREETGANVIGAWFDGEFVPNPGPDQRIERSTVLLVAGTETQLEAMRELTLSRRRGHDHDRIVVGGYGEVGETVRAVVEEASLETTVVDRERKPGVDVEGEVDDERTLRDAALESASGLVLALPDDTSTIFTVLVARQLNPDVEIVCRANEAESASKLYRADADYVLALATVAGRMLAGDVLGEEVLGLETGIELVRTEAPRLAGETPAGVDLRARTDCTVVAVERDDRVLTDVGPDFRFEAGDALVVAGTDDAITDFYDLVDAPVAED
ncbi:MAG: TrkA family potassium uptake protein [Halobacteriaceae archaeon]